MKILISIFCWSVMLHHLYVDKGRSKERNFYLNMFTNHGLHRVTVLEPYNLLTYDMRKPACSMEQKYIGNFSYQSFVFLSNLIFLFCGNHICHSINFTLQICLQMGFLFLQGKCCWAPRWSHGHYSQGIIQWLVTLVDPYFLKLIYIYIYIYYSFSKAIAQQSEISYLLVHRTSQGNETKRFFVAALLEKGRWWNIW
jgi:hypothetical protein